MSTCSSLNNERSIDLKQNLTAQATNYALENAYIKASNLNKNTLVQSAFSPQQNRRQLIEKSSKSINDEGTVQDYKSNRQSAAYSNNLNYGSYDQVLPNRAPLNPLSNSTNIQPISVERAINKFSSQSSQSENPNYQMQPPHHSSVAPVSKDYEHLKMNQYELFLDLLTFDLTFRPKD